MAEQEIGTVSHFFGRVSVAGIELSGELAVGDQIHIKGHTTDFSQGVNSMQIDGAEVSEAVKGQSVGIKVSDRCRGGDAVYKIVD